MRKILHLWKYIRPYRNRLGWNFLFNLLSSFFSVFSLLMIIPFLKLLFGTVPRVDQLPEGFRLLETTNFREDAGVWLNYRLGMLIAERGELSALLLICGAVLVVFFFKNLFRYLALLMAASIKKGVVRELHGELYCRMVRFPLSYYDKRKKGDLIARFSSDVQEVEYSIMHFMESMIKDPAAIVITLATMLALNVQLTMIVLITLPLSGLVIGKIGKRLKHQSRRVQDIMSVLVTRVEETISGMREIKAFTAENFMERQFTRDNREHYLWSRRMLWRRDLSSPLSEFLGIGVVVAILWLGGRMVFSAQVQPETFIAFILIFSQIISPAKAFANAYYFIQKGLASLERIEEVVEYNASDDSLAAGQPIREFSKNIEFENVTFSYGQLPVLHNVSFVIEKGDRVALEGPSGAGKSTVVDLLLDLYGGFSGDIMVDGRPLREVNAVDWRRLVALVPQQTILFNDSLYRNILFGHPDADEDAVRQAAAAARVDEFARELPEGLETQLSDNGANLSGGQRQRIAIARAFLKKAPILVLDEATSSLDADNESLIADTLDLLPPDQTVIIIAHRSSTISMCNKVISLRNGRVEKVRSGAS